MFPTNSLGPGGRMYEEDLKHAWALLDEELEEEAFNILRHLLLQPGLSKWHRACCHMTLCDGGDTNNDATADVQHGEKALELFKDISNVKMKHKEGDEAVAAMIKCSQDALHEARKRAADIGPPMNQNDYNKYKQDIVDRLNAEGNELERQEELELARQATPQDQGGARQSNISRLLTATSLVDEQASKDRGDGRGKDASYMSPPPSQPPKY